MAISFFSKGSAPGRNDQELSLVIDIESGLVRGSLVLFSHEISNADLSGPDTKPRIFYTFSSPIKSHTGKNGVKLLSAMLDSVSVVAENVMREGLKITSANSMTVPVSKIHVVFSSPWIISKTKTVKISYEKDTEVTKAAVTALLDGERKDLEKRFMAEHDDSLEFDLAFIEQKIFEVKLNGYPTAHFENKKAREFEVSFAISISSKSILSSIEKAIEKSVMTVKRNVECHSSLLLQYSALRSIVPGRNDYIAIHIHNELSDVIIVKNGICAGMASFPSGTATLSRTSSIALKQSNEVAHSSLNLHAKNAFHAAESKRIGAVADASVNNWSDELITTLGSLGQIDLMPHRIYLLANEHYSHFERAVAGIKSRSFEVTPIEKSILDSAVAHENKEKEDALMSMYVFALR